MVTTSMTRYKIKKLPRSFKISRHRSMAGSLAQMSFLRELKAQEKLNKDLGQIIADKSSKLVGERTRHLSDEAAVNTTHESLTGHLINLQIPQDQTGGTTMMADTAVLDSVERNSPSIKDAGEASPTFSQGKAFLKKMLQTQLPDPRKRSLKKKRSQTPAVGSIRSKLRMRAITPQESHERIEHAVFSQTQGVPKESLDE